LFYLDFLGNVEEERVRNALNHLQELVEFVDVLGCYEKDTAAEGQRI
jgi:prephenate dehydratase